MSEEFEEQRRKLVERMVERGTLESENVKKAFLNVKRELFFREHKQHAYIDSAFPIGFGQTISQPSTIAVMLELLEVKKGMRVLEIGSGCGYVLALLSELVGEKGKVYGVELLGELAGRSLKNLNKAGIENVQVKQGDGTRGWKKHSPFDRILVSAASVKVPNELIEQLSPNGRLVMPVGPRHTQRMKVVSKNGNGKANEHFPGKGYFVFVPLRAKH